MIRVLNIRSVFNILGYLEIILGLSMIVPLIISYSYGDGASEGILISSLITIVIGFASVRFFSQNKDLSLRDGFLVVTAGWMIMALFGSLPYWITGAIPSLTDAVFESMSGFSTTGATILTDIEIMPKSLLFWRAMTHWIGGMGIIVLSLAILPMLGIGGMQLFKAEVPGPTADKLTPRIHQTAKILWLVYAGLTALETVFLMFGGMDWFDAVCHSFATMATGGFSTMNASVGAYDSAYIDYVITFFMLLAGANFALHYKFFINGFNVHIKDFEFKIYLYIILAITVLIILSNMGNGVYESLSDALRYGLFQAVSIVTTTGFGTADYEEWTILAQLLLFTLMFIGGCAGSTGGGMKVVRVVVVIKQGFLELKKMIHPNAVLPLRFGGKVIGKDVTYAIIGFFLLYILIFAVVSIAMAALGLDLLTSFGAAASCLGNIGPGLGNVGPTDNFAFIPDLGKWILTFSMMLGRLEIYTVLVILTKGFWSK